MSVKDDARAIADKGTEALYAHKWDEAIALAKKALEVDPECDQAEKVWGLAMHFKGDTPEGITHLYRAVRFNPKYATGWYNLACIHAQGKEKSLMLKALAEAINWGKSEYCMDYRKSAMDDKDFENFRNDADFLALVFPVPPMLKELYLAVWANEGDKILELGEKLLKDQKADKLAILEAMRYGAEIISSDLDEHGEVNLSLYEHEDKKYYDDLYKELDKKVLKLRAEGVKSDIWLKFKGKDDDNEDLKEALACLTHKGGN
jgi:tetratricopeptide (TPR) repeat protein